MVESQKDSQQRNILKLLFGVYQEPKTGAQSRRLEVQTEKQNGETVAPYLQQISTKKTSRSELDIRTLNSVIQDIFPVAQKSISETKNQVQESSSGEAKGKKELFDLSYLDLSGLHFSALELSNANLQAAHLEGAKLWDAHLEGAYLRGAHLEGAYLGGAHLEGAIFFDLSGSLLGSPTREQITNCLKVAKRLPEYEELLKVKGFDEALVDQIIQTHRDQGNHKTQ